MDAAYLEKNINESLAEALTSMAVNVPDDPIEYIGKYLVTKVERLKQFEAAQVELGEVETKLSEEEAATELKNKALESQEKELKEKESKYQTFLESLAKSESKQQAMDSVVNFMELEMNIPAAYIAVKKVAGEVETLCYVSASPSQVNIVKGKKIVKAAPAEDDEGPVQATGFTFDALKVPEVPEGEEEEEPAEGEEKAPKPVPKPSPLVIDNVKRDSRCKFFGVPKIGAFVACPFSYETIEHESGCSFNAGDAESGVDPSYQLNSIKAEFVIAFDSIGEYRLFKPAEIEKVNNIGEVLSNVFVTLEKSIGEKHLEFVNVGPKDMAGKCSAVTAKVAETDAQVATAMGEYNAEEGESELKKPMIEAEKASTAVGSILATDIEEILKILERYELPLPAAVLNMLFCVSAIAGIDTASLVDCCGDPSWSVMRNKLQDLPSAIGAFKPDLESTVTSNTSIAAIKNMCETMNLLDASVYPADLPVFPIILTWFQKAIAAREAAIAFHAETGKSLETIA